MPQRKRILGLFLTIAILGAYALTALRGPQGLQALFEKYREIRTLEAKNAAAVVENQRTAAHEHQRARNGNSQAVEVAASRRNDLHSAGCSQDVRACGSRIHDAVVRGSP
jgi:hypothetical protein